MLNIFLDNLSTKNNLSRWGKRINAKCIPCGYKETLQHVLNNCHTKFDQGRYTWHHNSVLCIIMDTLKDVSDQSWNFYCDLTGAKKKKKKQAPRFLLIPPDILPTQQTPSLLLINESTRGLAEKCRTHDH